MKYDPEKHHRRSIRIKEYDYSQCGAYFLTVCTQNKECLFGNIADGKTDLNSAGEMAQQCWREIPRHYPFVVLDEFVVMPNHVHGILMIENHEKAGANDDSPLRTKPDERANDDSPLQHPPDRRHRPKGTSNTIGAIIRGFKIGVTKWFRANTNTRIVWQRNYYEHIIRDVNDLKNNREYILNNPLKWHFDDLFINNL